MELHDWRGRAAAATLLVAIGTAGPARVKSWLRAYGDPRSPAVDAIDWIESILLNETRNYVQRVLENLQVYRHALAGAPVAVRLVEDLSR